MLLLLNILWPMLKDYEFNWLIFAVKNEIISVLYTGTTTRTGQKQDDAFKRDCTNEMLLIHDFKWTSGDSK